MRSASIVICAILAGTVAVAVPAVAAPAKALPAAPQVTWADLADLADSAPLVLRAQVAKLARIEPVRAGPAPARNVRPGWGRFYAEAKTLAMIAGNGIVAEKLTYLVDLPLDAKGKPPALGKKTVLLFARPVADRPGELQLVAPDAQVLWDPVSESRLRTILTALVSPDVPPRITGVREAIHIPGNLAGEGETQVFLSAQAGGAAAISIARRPGAAPTWGVTFSEVAEAGSPPLRETLGWYRLACFLPPALPAGVNLSEGPEAQAIANADYRLVVGGLGACPRLRR